jgi:hypothetical protein
VAKAVCPDCDEAGREEFLREITPGDLIDPDHPGRARYYTIVLHSDGQGGLCPGGGKRV